jgi:hypothetical protein
MHVGLIADAEIANAHKYSAVTRLTDLRVPAVAVCCKRRRVSRDMLVGLLFVSLMITTPSTPLLVRDLLYLDFDKAASIWSQFEEGLPERTSVTEDVGKTRAAGTKFGVGVAGANLGVDYIDKRSTLQSKTLHHDVLNSVEQRLADAGLVTDLSVSVPSSEASPERIRATFEGRPYLRAEGASVLEDYRRILAISEKFNDLVGFVARSAQEGIKKSPEFQQLEALLAAATDAANKLPDRNQKAVQREKAKAAQRQLQELAKPKLSKVDQWILDGIRLWINTFMPTRINFRVFPFPNAPSFQVLCNLKEKCFVDSDLEHLLYGTATVRTCP